MNKLLTNPSLIAALGVLSGTVVGLGWFWRAAEMVVAAAIAAVPPSPLEEQQAQGWDFWTIEIDGLASELKEERARLQQQAELLNQRAARLSAEQQELAKIRADIEAMRAEIGRKVIEARDAMASRRQEYIEANRRLKTVQKLEERARDHHRIEVRRADQNELDELAGFRAFRQTVLTS